MTTIDRTNATDAEFAERVAAFDGASVTVEHMTGVLLTAILGNTDGELVSGDLPAEEVARLISEVAAPAALAVVAQQPHPAVQRVEALAAELDAVKWTEWRADDAADAIRAALAGDPQ